MYKGCTTLTACQTSRRSVEYTLRELNARVVTWRATTRELRLQFVQWAILVCSEAIFLAPLLFDRWAIWEAEVEYVVFYTKMFTFWFL